MSEVIAALRSGVDIFLDGRRNDVQHSLNRMMTMQAFGTEVEISQHKIVPQDEVDRLFTEGPEAFATREWFNDVRWIEGFGHKYSDIGRLLINATYPMKYFEVPPKYGSFSGDKWLDQYGRVTGYSSGKKTTDWELRFVAPGSRAITYLSHPEDPTALERYNARYKQYLETLNEADATISYGRVWERDFPRKPRRHNAVIGGMSLLTAVTHKIIKEGSQPSEDYVDYFGVSLDVKTDKKQPITRQIRAFDDDEALTRELWDKIEPEVASGELLETALVLVQKATK